ncbi:MAG: VanZ family protein [Candidatus Omnitrophota bacterium]
MPNKIINKGFIMPWLPVLFCLGFIFYASSIPGSSIPPLFAFQDIVFHFVIYLILGFLFIRALRNTCLGIGWEKAIVFTIIFGIIYGVNDELHQGFAPYRCVSGLDVFIDSLGVFAGSLAYFFLKKHFNTVKKFYNKEFKVG